MMTSDNNEFLVCPEDHSRLLSKNNKLICDKCKKEYDIRYGIPDFYCDSSWDDLYLSDVTYHREAPLLLPDGYKGFLYLHKQNNFGTILDMGAGDGVFSYNAPNESKVYCVDVSAASLKRLKQRNNDNLIPILATGNKLPFNTGSFDTVLFVYVIEHIAKGNDRTILEEIKRVMKDDALLIYTTDTPFFDKHVVRWTDLLLRGKLRKQDHISETGHINLMTLEESRVLVKSAGFEITEEYPYWMGKRFKIWNKTLSFLRTILPKSLTEDYLSSNYTLILKKT